jgi:hypothetical protein
MKANKFRTYGEFLFEGGNAKAIDRSTGETIARAEKIDLNKYERKKIVSEILQVLEKLNELFQKRYSKKIWNNFEIVKSGKTFSGSSEFFFDQKISDEEFIRHKPIIGDIDVIIPREISAEFQEFILTFENKKITPRVKYLGQDRTDFRNTWLGVFRYSDKKDTFNFQLDFEYGDWNNRKQSPSEWAKFSHGSSWEDISQGMKGVHHKYLITNLARTLSKREDIVIATPSSTPENVNLVSGKKSEQTPRLLAFSVNRGLRVKYAQMYDSKGKPVKVNRKLVFQEIPTSKSDYIKDVPGIFFRIFGEEPSAQELREFNSFVGLADIVKRKLSKEEVETLFDFILHENLFGKKAQYLEKNLDLDKKIKWDLANKMLEIFPFLEKKRREVETMSIEYYEKN